MRPAVWRLGRGVAGPDAPGSSAAMLQTRVADGVHRAEDADTNWYLVQDGTG
jgi:hypothetical protein